LRSDVNGYGWTGSVVCTVMEFFCVTRSAISSVVDDQAGPQKGGIFQFGREEIEKCGCAAVLSRYREGSRRCPLLIWCIMMVCARAADAGKLGVYDKVLETFESNYVR
jgi:hypothetical protein